MAVSDALQMARKYDKKGRRTLGVLTKVLFFALILILQIDIMDDGCNAKNMLLGKVIKLKLGYVGVKGRSA